jgi:hypothetical protein
LQNRGNHSACPAKRQTQLRQPIRAEGFTSNSHFDYM